MAEIVSSAPTIRAIHLYSSFNCFSIIFRPARYAQNSWCDFEGCEEIFQASVTDREVVAVAATEAGAVAAGDHGLDQSFEIIFFAFTGKPAHVADDIFDFVYRFLNLAGFDHGPALPQGGQQVQAV